MDIQVSYDASAAAAPSWFKSAVAAAVAKIDALISNPITLNLQLGWGEENNNAIKAGCTAQNQSAGTYMSYAALTAALSSHAVSANERAAAAALPAGDPTNGGKFYVPNAMLKTLGLKPATASGVDGYVGLDASRAWSLNANGVPTAGTFDPVGILEHEFTEVLGRVGYLGSAASNGIYGPMDLFRYTAPGQHSVTPGPGFFSVDGQTMLQQFNDPRNGGDAADWTPSLIGDMFGNSSAGLAAKMSTTDLKLLDVLGYGVNIPVTPPPSVTLDQDVVFASPSTAVLTGTVSDPGAAVSVFDGATLLGNASVGANGSWTLNAALPAGTYDSLRAVATLDGLQGTTAANFTLQTGIENQPYTTLEQDFDAAGNLIGESYDRRQGAVYLKDTIQNLADGTHLMDYAGGTFFDNKRYSEYQVLMSADWQVMSRTNFNNDGTETNGNPVARKAKLAAAADAGQVFRFSAHPGQALVSDFTLAGADHDILSLPASQFASVADILSQMRTLGHDAVITLGRNETVTVQNVTAAALAHHLDDLRLHA